MVPDAGSVRVRAGKGLKPREVFLGAEGRHALTTWWNYRQEFPSLWAETYGAEAPPAAEWPNGFLFLGQRGPFTIAGVERICQKVGLAAGVDLHPHRLRHTFAKSLVDPGAYGITKEPMPLTVLQELLGHASLLTTSRYLQPNAEDLKRWME
jgi:site-specific recombinase XerD